MQAAFVIPRDQVAVGGRRDQIRNGTGIVHYHRGLRLLIRLGTPAGYATQQIMHLFMQTHRYPEMSTVSLSEIPRLFTHKSTITFLDLQGIDKMINPGTCF